MEINWVTFIAQIVNFIILLLLLKALLYRRIVNAMKAREEKIASSLDDAKQTKAKAEKEIEEFSKKKKEIDDMREDLLFKVKQEVDTIKRDLTENARKDVNQVHERWLKSLEEKERAFLNEVQNRIMKQVYEISKRALKNLADSQLETQILNVFMDKIESMPDQDIEKLRDSIKRMDSKVLIVSSFEVPDSEKHKVQNLIDSHISKNARVEFNTSTDLICGIKIKTHEIEIAWTFEEYLENLEQSLSGIFDEEIRMKKQTPVKDPVTQEDSEPK